MLNGWIKLHKRVVNWEWYSDPLTFRLFVHFLICANFKDSQWRGLTIKRGELVIGRKSLSDKLCISEQTIRTSIKRLKSTSEITTRSTNHFTIVTITNYDSYQNESLESIQPYPEELTNDQPATNQQLTTAEEVKKKKEVKNKDIKHFVPPTSEEVKLYCQGRCNGVDPVTFVSYYEMRNWMLGQSSKQRKMVSWKAAVRYWERSPGRNNGKRNTPTTIASSRVESGWTD